MSQLRLFVSSFPRGAWGTHVRTLRIPSLAGRGSRREVARLSFPRGNERSESGFILSHNNIVRDTRAYAPQLPFPQSEPDLLLSFAYRDQGS